MVIKLEDIQNSKFNKPPLEIPAGADLSNIGKQPGPSVVDIERTTRTKDGTVITTVGISMEVKDANELKEVLDAIGYEKKTGLLDRLLGRG